MLQGVVLAPFLFIIVIDYVSKRSAEDLTHKGNNQDNSGRAVRSTTRLPDYKINDLAFADDIALLENVQKTEQMRLNQSFNLSPTDPLTIKGQPINIVEDFKYLESYVGSTDRDIKVWIGLAWAAFAKLK